MNQIVTLEQLQAVVPKKSRHNITAELTNKINQVIANDDYAEEFKSNIIGFADVLKDGKFGIDEYLNAVRYVSYKLMGNGNTVAYCKTFPERHQRLLDEGKGHQLDGFVGAYNRTKLVNLILEQTMVPTYILNASLYQEAINVQFGLMTTAKSEKVRSDAANSLLTHLKVPEAIKVKVDVHTNNTDLEELRDMTRQLAAQQQRLISQGVMSAGDTAKRKLIISDIVDGEFSESPKDS